MLGVLALQCKPGGARVFLLGADSSRVLSSRHCMGATKGRMSPSALRCAWVVCQVPARLQRCCWWDGVSNGLCAAGAAGVQHGQTGAVRVPRRSMCGLHLGPAPRAPPEIGVSEERDLLLLSNAEPASHGPEAPMGIQGPEYPCSQFLSTPVQ